MYPPSEDEARAVGARQASIDQYKGLLGERDSELGLARRNYGSESYRWTNLENDLRNADDTCNAIFARLQRRSDGFQLSGRWFLLAFIILAILEMPINKFMIDNILRTSNIGSYLVSFVMTLAMLALAHFAGHKIRQVRSEYQEKVYWGYVLLSIVIMTVLALFIGAVTIGRAFFSVAGPVTGGRDMFAEIGRQIASAGGPWTAFIQALQVRDAFFLACLNTVGIALAFVAAFVNYDSDKVYQSALDDKEKAKSGLLKMFRRYIKKVDAIERKFAPRLSVISASHSAQNSRVVEMKRRRNAELDADDKFDITGLDNTLAATRAELNRKYRQIRPGDAEKDAAANAAVEMPTVSHLSVRDRR
jgi:hypothetical protein